MSKLLIVSDQGKACVATTRGLQLARKLGLEAEVVAFTYAPLRKMGMTSKEDQARARSRLLENREVEVQARIDKAAKKGQRVKFQVVWKKEIDEWLLTRLKKGYAAVVKTGHRSGSAVYTSTDWQLLRESPVPVMVLSEKRWHRTKPVLVTVDLTTTDRNKRKLNDLVISTGQAVAEALDAPLNIISAIHISPVLTELDLVDPLAYTRKAREEMKPYISQLAERHGLPEKAFRTKRGPVAKVITSEAAKQRAQLVVMGTVGRTGVRARLMGNTAEDVLRDMNTDVLAMKGAVPLLPV